MLTLNQKENKMLWESGINAEQYNLIYGLLIKKQVVTIAEKTILDSLTDAPFEGELWFNDMIDLLQCYSNFFDIEEVVNELKEYAKDIQTRIYK